MIAHDFIWLQNAANSDGPDFMEVTWCCEPMDDDDTEYVRRDPAVIAALPETRAMLADALERAVEQTLPDGWRETAHEEHAKPGLKAQRVWASGYNACQTAIRALIPADHAAALAARDAASERRGMERAAVIVDDHYAKGDMGNPGHFIRAEMGGEA
jgi:hypothetical protein